MNPIFHNSLDEHHGYESFYENFINTCNHHRGEGNAMAFAFILYDFESPHLSKVLKDTDYWQSLNSTSGKYLSIFSIHFKTRRRVRARTDYGGETMIQYLTSYHDYRNPGDSYNDIISRYFGASIKVTYPAVLFFQVNNEMVTDAFLVELNSKTIEKSFNELKEYIDAAVDALKHISPNNYNNHNEIFECLRTSVNSRRAINNVKRLSRVGKSVIEFVSAITGIKK